MTDFKRKYSPQKNRSSATALKVLLEDRLAIPLRDAQSTHPALEWPDGSRPSFSLIIRRSLDLYLGHLRKLRPEQYEAEHDAIAKLS